MSPWAWIRRACINGFPRVSGDEPDNADPGGDL